MSGAGGREQPPARFEPYQEYARASKYIAALKEARNAVRKRLVERDGVDHPRYWGAFILEGPPAPFLPRTTFDLPSGRFQLFSQPDFALDDLRIHSVPLSAEEIRALAGRIP